MNVNSEIKKYEKLIGRNIFLFFLEFFILSTFYISGMNEGRLARLMLSKLSLTPEVIMTSSLFLMVISIFSRLKRAKVLNQKINFLERKKFIQRKKFYLNQQNIKNKVYVLSKGSNNNYYYPKGKVKKYTRNW